MADTRLICTPWTDPLDRPGSLPDAVEDDQWEAAVWTASEILYLLSGRQWAGACESTATLYSPQDGGCGWFASWPPGDAGWPVSWVSRGGSGKRVVALPEPPITAVTSVQIDGEDVEYHVTLPAGLLRRRNGASWPVDGSLQVAYTHGIRPPTGGVEAAKTLAAELAKAASGSGTCELPTRVQSIVREGVTATFVDSFESLNSGRTGLYTVDLWLASVNPRGMTRRARVWSPSIQRAQRTTS